MTERCERTELLVDDCAHCRGNDKTVEEQAAADTSKIRARLLAHPAWFAAQYAGACWECGERFPAGAAIHAVGRTGCWISECCGEEYL